MRLQKFLSRAGVASRRKAEGLIEAGVVAVNGRVVRELGTKVDPEQDVVTVHGSPVELAKTRWVMYHKPAGVLTTQRDPHGGRTIYDELGPESAGLRYVGRLDKDTTGLLLLSNDGDAIHRLTHPSSGVEREYEATVRGTVSDEVLERLLAGVELEDGPARAKRVERLSSRQIALVLTEGRKREVRRMLRAVGCPVEALHRVRYGAQKLGILRAGQSRELTAEEVAALTSRPGRT